MHITIINDCKDANAVGRQTTRVATLFGATTSFIGVSSDLEVAGNLIDALDAFEKSAGVILVNVAPRDKDAKSWENGTPFGYFWYKNILVITTIDGLTLSLIKKLNLIKTITVLDIPTTLKHLTSQKMLPKNLEKYITESQFRSYDFSPRVAYYLLKKKNLPGVEQKINSIPDAPNAIWWVDNFGNCKTTILKDDIELQGSQVKTKIGTLPYFDQLKDVPDNGLALITGSSGINDNRFLEIVIQDVNGSASKSLGIKSGALVL